MDASQITPESFQQVIIGILNTDNTVRKQAENVYYQLKSQNPSICVQYLVQILRQSSKSEDRSLCAVLLRKVLTKDVQQQLPKHLLDAVKQELMKSMTEELDSQVRNKVCDTVSDVASQGGQEWPQLLPFLFQCINSEQNNVIFAGFTCLADLADVYHDQIQQHLEPIMLCYNKIYTSKSLELKSVATKSVIAIVLAFEYEDRDILKWQTMTPQFIQVLMQSVQEGDTGMIHAETILENLIELSDYNPLFLKPNVQELSTILLEISKAEQVDEKLKILAVECLLSLCEAREKAPGMMKKNSGVIKELFGTLMNFLLLFEDDEDWYTAEDDNDQSGEEDSYQAGQEGLDRLAIAVGGKQLLPIMGPLLKTWIQDEKWQKRNASLICVTQVAEGCQKTIKQFTNEIIELALVGARDTQPQVRWAASQALGQLCTDLSPEIQTKYHHVIVPALLHLLQDYQQSRVQAHAAAAMVNFCEGCDKKILSQYMVEIVDKLLIVLQKGQKISVQVGLTAMAQVAETMERDFGKVFDQVIGILIHYLQQNDPNMQTARARALECATLVGIAVGKEKFGPYAHQIIQFLQQFQDQKLADDDPLNQFRLSAGGRLCKILDKDFVTYLPVVMPSLIVAANVQPISVEQTDPASYAENQQDSEGEDGVESIFLNDKEVKIKSALLEEKALAISLLANYAEQLQEDFLPYVHEVSEIMIKGLKTMYNEEIRLNSVEGLPLLIKCVVVAKEKGKFTDNSALQNMVVYIFNELVAALDQEMDIEIQTACTESIEMVVEEIEPFMVSKEMNDKVFQVFRTVIDSVEEQKADKMKNVSELDEEEQELVDEDLEKLRENQDRIFSCMGVFLKKYGDQAFPYVEPFLLDVQKLLASSNAEDKRIGLCLIDDLIENTPQQTINYSPQMYKVLYEHSQHEDTDVRHIAIFGLGLILERMTSFIQQNTQLISQATEQAIKIMDLPDAQSEENIYAFENALSLIAKVISMYPQQAPSLDYLTQRMLQGLPITNDITEAQRVHGIVADLVLQGQRGSGLLDQNPAYAKIVLEIALQVLGSSKELLAEPDYDRYVQIVKGITQKLGQTELTSAMGKLTPEEQQKCQTYLQKNF